MSPPAPERDRRYVAVDVGGAYACAVTDTGEAVCWEGVANKVARPAPDSGRYVAVSDGYGHTCGLAADGEAVCWGWNTSGSRMFPAGRYAGISAGDASTCALTEAAGAVCWFPNRLDPQSRNEWIAPPHYTAVGTSGYDTCLLTDAGDVYCRDREAWESGAGLQLVSEGVRSAEISVGLNRTCALANSGAIVCWGDTQHVYAPFLVRHGYQRWR